jgi:hypothetical protein
MNKLMAFFALAVMVGFLGILAYKVPSPDLIVVIALTVGLVLYDVITSAFRKND